MYIDAGSLDFRALNEAIRAADDVCHITGCLGQRFIAAGMSGKKIEIDGIPGNALGAYLGTSAITVHGSAQDAVGDTMNDGTIVVECTIGEAAGYAMRGGAIYIRDNAGYRAGIHMKEYKDKKPVIVIGGRAGSFLGEYQAGGVIVVLGLHTDTRPIVGNFPATGMHGGKMILRGTVDGIVFPPQVNLRTATKADKAEFAPYIRAYSAYFGTDTDALLADTYTVVTPDSRNPYRQMYVAN